MERSDFFSFKEAKQPVNQWLCIAFLGLLCFWTVLIYSTYKAYSIADVFSVSANINK